MTEKILAILHMTGDTLSDPSRRCVGSSAKDASGRDVAPTDTCACRWCLTGALCHAMNEFGVSDPYEEIEIYSAMKDVIGLEQQYCAPVFWDSTDILHDVIAHKLRVAK